MASIPRKRMKLNPSQRTTSKRPANDKLLSQAVMSDPDEFYKKLFDAMLEFMREQEVFEDESVPSVFVVYAHDNEELSYDAGARFVQEIIQWLKQVSFPSLVSDQSPVPGNRRVLIDTGDPKDILATQIGLLPALRSFKEPGVIDSYDKVLVFRSKILNDYSHKDLYQPFKEELEQTYNKVMALQSCTPVKELIHVRYKAMRDVIESQEYRDLNHVLTELAFLEIRYSRDDKRHGIIPVCIDDRSESELIGFNQKLKLRAGPLAPENLHRRHKCFLLKILPRIHGAAEYGQRLEPEEIFRNEIIGIVADCYQRTCDLFQVQQRQQPQQ